VADAEKLENLVDVGWLCDVLATLRGTLVQIRDSSRDPQLRTAIALVDACLAIIGKSKEDSCKTHTKSSG
jgi:hypothetical protein